MKNIKNKIEDSKKLLDKIKDAGCDSDALEKLEERLIQCVITFKRIKGSDDEVSERIVRKEIVKVPAGAIVVKTQLGLTISLAKYEFARVDAGIEIPCAVKDIEQTFKKAWSIVEGEVAKETRDVKKDTPAKVSDSSTFKKSIPKVGKTDVRF